MLIWPYELSEEAYATNARGSGNNMYMSMHAGKFMCNIQNSYIVHVN